MPLKTAKPNKKARKETAMKTDMSLFEDHKTRRFYDEDTETWWFSVIDIVQILVGQADYQTARKYWSKLKQRLAKEGSQLVTNCHQLKMTASDGKNYLTDVATAETQQRLVHSLKADSKIPSKSDQEQ